MKVFDWKEVVSFLRKNLDAKFEYSCPRPKRHRGRDQYGCLMAQFFDSQKVRFSVVSYEGTSAKHKGRVVAMVVNGPEFIGSFHLNPTSYTLTGRQLLQNLIEGGWA